MFSHSLARGGLATGVVLAALVAATAFYLGRNAGSGPPAEAGPAALPTPRDAQARSEIETIDTSKPDWERPYVEAWQARPRSNQVINGILVGPDADRPLACPDGQLVRAAAAVAQGSDLAIVPAYLPSGVHLVPDDQGIDSPAATCNGVVTYNYQKGSLADAPDLETRLAAGESWFSIPHWGRISVSKWRYPKGAAPALDANHPSDAWEARTINGLPAAVAHPVLDAGLGQGIVTIWDAEKSVHTTVVTYNVSLEELLKIAEGIR